MAVEAGQGDTHRGLVEDGAQLLVTFEQRLGSTERLRVRHRQERDAPETLFGGRRICGLSGITRRKRLRCRGRPARAGAAILTLSRKRLSVVAVVWQFTLHENTDEEFEHFYGADGEWTKLSRKSRSFLGSSFLKDLASPTRYLLIEYWSEMLVYEKHVADFDTQLKTLEEQRKSFAVSVESLGLFSALDVPTRVGPTWSRRSGG
jgi:hypothetical protein